MANVKPVKWTAKSVQYALAVQFDYIRHCIVPNIHLGGNDEMDLAILTSNHHLWEVEIKVTMFDWQRDLIKQKWKGHGVEEATPSRFYYAVPEKLVPRMENGVRKIPDWLPKQAGVVVVTNVRNRTSLPDGTMVITDNPRVNIIKTATPLHRNKLPQKYVDEMYRKLSIRFWKMNHKHEPGRDICLPET